MTFLIVLGAVSATLGVFAIYASWNRVKYPERFYQMMQKYNTMTSPKTKSIKDIKRGGLICIFLGILLLVVALFSVGFGFKSIISSTYDSPPSKVESKPVDEDTMNDLGYYKENGKWNYEGGDAGQNDGRSGD